MSDSVTVSGKIDLALYSDGYPPEPFQLKQIYSKQHPHVNIPICFSIFH